MIIILLENEEFVIPTEEATAIGTTPASDCFAVCGSSEEYGTIYIDVARLLISFNEILWVECSKCDFPKSSMIYFLKSEIVSFFKRNNLSFCYQKY